MSATPSEASDERPVVVGIGASAGGLDALMRMFSSLPANPRMSFVVIQHLDPTHESALTEILQRKTSLRVQEVIEDVEIEDGCVYVIPPGEYLSIKNGVLKPEPPTKPRGSRMAVDYFFRSLSEDLCEYAVGVLLSGTGTDGTAGLKEIKMCGGLTIVQDPHDAEHIGMPQSAINSLEVDFTLTAEQIGQRLTSYVQHVRPHSLLSAQALIKRLQAEVSELRHELDTTRRKLSIAVDDLEMANEELKAANEESMAVNEELQAGNEELETSKEELQSLNEELVTLNNQLELKLHQLQDTTDDLNNLLLSTHLPTVFIDTHFRIRRFTPSATELLHLSASDKGRPLSDVRADFDTNEVFELAREVLESLQPRNCDVKSMNGKSFLGRLQPYRTEDNHIRGVVMTFSDVTDLRRSKEIAQSRLAELETIYEATPIGLSFIAKDRTYRSINRRLAEVNGVSVEDTIGKTLRDVLPEPFVDGVEECYEKVFASGKPIDNLEVTGQTYADEKPRKYRVSYHPVFSKQPGDQDVIGVNAVVEDVTELRRIELELSTSEERLRQIAEVSDYVFWITQIEPEQVLYVSPAYEQVWGQSANVLLEHARNWSESIHPDDRLRVARAFERFVSQPDQASFEVEYRIVREGETRWIADKANAIRDPDGSISRVAGVARDITDTKEAFNQLEISESRARLAIDLAKIGVIEVNYKTNSAILDDFAAETFGLPADEEVPRAEIHDRFHPEEREKLLAEINRFIDDPDERVDSFEHRVLRPDGEVRWVRASKRVYYETVGTKILAKNTVVAVLDFTDQHKQRERLARARDDAEAANRSRGEFLANMSHEIRTPMAAILGHADILNDHLEDPDDLSVVDTIRRNGRHLLDIINDILDLSKIDAGKMEIESRPVRPDAIVGEVRSLMDVRAAEKRVPLKIEFDGPVPEMIDTDPVRLRQVLLNLVGNAIKFTDEGEVRFVIRYDETNRLMHFDVIDTGLGIAEDKLESLFEPFTQADATNTRAAGGTGLGLTICRRLANSLGGDIHADSKLGEGSRFSLLLDVRGDRQLIEPNLNRESSVKSTHQDIELSCSVLIVDDRRDIRFLAQHFVEKSGGTVYTAINGKEAVDFVFSDNQPKIDLILLDMQMPVMDGYEAAAELRRRGCELPIIAVTANAMKEDRDQCLAAGCTDYTTKPLDSQEVISMIARHVARDQPS